VRPATEEARLCCAEARDVPATFSSLDPVEGAVQRRKTARYVAETAERFRQLTKERSGNRQLTKESIVTRMRPGRGVLVERIAQSI
jgi:hypothetical protein